MILIAMMVIPLQPWMLDILFTSNLLVSLLVLMVALQTFRCLRFFKFSHSFAFATVLRLGLNVASTMILKSSMVQIQQEQLLKPLGEQWLEVMQSDYSCLQY